MNHDTTVFVGLDVHKDSITAACIGTHPSEPPVDLGTIGTQQYAIDRLLKKLSGRGTLQFVYEAGPCGFWLERYLRSKGERCLVAAPSLIPRRPGERINLQRARVGVSPFAATGCYTAAEMLRVAALYHQRTLFKSTLLAVVVHAYRFVGHLEA